MQKATELIYHALTSKGWRVEKNIQTLVIYRRAFRADTPIFLPNTKIF